MSEFKFNVGDKVLIEYFNYKGNGRINASFLNSEGSPTHLIELDESVRLEDFNQSLSRLCFREEWLKEDPTPVVGDGAYNTEIIDKDTVKVGCQTVTRVQINKLLEAMDKHQS